MHASRSRAPAAWQPLLAAGSPHWCSASTAAPPSTVVVGSRGHSRIARLLRVRSPGSWRGTGRAGSSSSAAQRAGPTTLLARSWPGWTVARPHAALDFAAEEPHSATFPSWPSARWPTREEAWAVRTGGRGIHEPAHPLGEAASRCHRAATGQPGLAASGRCWKPGPTPRSSLRGPRQGRSPRHDPGSVAAALLHYAPCPVGIVRPAPGQG